MFSIFRFRLTSKIFLSFLLIILFPSSISILISYRLIRNTITYETALRLRDGILGFDQEIQFTEKRCQHIAMELATDSDIRHLFLESDHTNLQEKLVETYSLVDVDILEIEDTNGKVVLRGHNPELSGDLKLEQHIVQEGLRGKSTVSYEKGKSGIAIRAVSPILSEGRTMGLIMVGSLFSDKFVNRIKLLTGMENGIYRDRQKIISTYNGFDLIDDLTLEKLKDNSIVNRDDVRINGEAYSLILKPMFLENDEYWGSLALAVSRKEGLRYLSYTRNILVLIISIGIAIAVIIFILLGRNINFSLKKIVQGINDINLNDFTTRIALSGKDEFRMIAESVNRMVKKLRRYSDRIQSLQDEMIRSAKLTTVGQLAAGIAHEIRNPLSSIRMLVQVLQKKCGREGDPREVSIILNEIDRINKLVKDLLEFSKPSPMNFSKQDINDLVRNVLEIFSYNIQHQGIAIEQLSGENVPLVSVDPEKMSLVLINLIMNAIQAMPAGGTLTIETAKRDISTVRVTVSDTGVGIRKEDLKNVFEPFFTTKQEGTGLGLPLVKMIVERHGGKVRLLNSAGSTRISIDLPTSPSPLIPTM